MRGALTGSSAASSRMVRERILAPAKMGDAHPTRSCGGGVAGACKHSLPRVLSQRTRKLLCDSGPARPPRPRSWQTHRLQTGATRHWFKTSATAPIAADATTTWAIDEAYSLVKHQAKGRRRQATKRSCDARGTARLRVAALNCVAARNELARGAVLQLRSGGGMAGARGGWIGA